MFIIIIIIQYSEPYSMTADTKTFSVTALMWRERSALNSGLCPRNRPSNQKLGDFVDPESVYGLTMEREP